MNMARVYYAGKVFMEFYVGPFDLMKLDPMYVAVINNGYIKYPESHQVFPSKWAKGDGTPVLLEDVPKELRVLELLNST
jgi:hypothetical protein